jgi:hypothetical protein
MALREKALFFLLSIKRRKNRLGKKEESITYTPVLRTTISEEQNYFLVSINFEGKLMK